MNIEIKGQTEKAFYLSTEMIKVRHIDADNQETTL